MLSTVRPDDGVSTTACSVVAMAESGVLSSTRDGQQPLARKPPSPPHSAPTSSNNKVIIYLVLLYLFLLISTILSYQKLHVSKLIN